MLEDRCFGCILGAFTGDACGSFNEFNTAIANEDKMNKCMNSNKNSCFLHDMAIIACCTHTTTTFLIILERAPTLNITSAFYTFEIACWLLFCWNQWTSLAVHSIRVLFWLFLASKNIRTQYWILIIWYIKINSKIFKVLLP